MCTGEGRVDVDDLFSVYLESVLSRDAGEHPWDPARGKLLGWGMAVADSVLSHAQRHQKLIEAGKVVQGSVVGSLEVREDRSLVRKALSCTGSLGTRETQEILTDLRERGQLVEPDKKVEADRAAKRARRRELAHGRGVKSRGLYRIKG